jgi:predicted GIY-YIG superfamily endonuclease
MENTFIYSLSDPITNEIRYIGKTNNIKKRLCTHLTKSNLIKKKHKNNWIKNLLFNNTKPLIEVIDEVPIKVWEYWEKFWISQFKIWGFKLTNSTDGGDGVVNDIKFGKDNNNFRIDITKEIVLKLLNEGLSINKIAIKLKADRTTIKKRITN